MRTISVSDTYVYVGGDFISIGHEPRKHVAALDTTGVATEWNQKANSRVAAISIFDSTIYLGGFSRL